MGTPNSAAELPEITEIRKLVSDLPVEIHRVTNLERSIAMRGAAVVEAAIALVKPQLRYLTYPPDPDEDFLEEFGPYARIAVRGEENNPEHLLINRDGKLYVERVLGSSGSVEVEEAVELFGLNAFLNGLISLLRDKMEALARQRAHLAGRLNALIAAEKSISS